MNDELGWVGCQEPQDAKSLWQALVSVIWRDVQCVTVPCVPCPQFRPLALVGARPPAHALDKQNDNREVQNQLSPSPN